MEQISLVCSFPASNLSFAPVQLLAMSRILLSWPAHLSFLASSFSVHPVCSFDLLIGYLIDAKLALPTFRPSSSFNLSWSDLTD